MIMTSSPELAADAAEQARVGLSRVAYNEGRVRVHDADLTGYGHLVASRQGLFALREEGYKLVARGYFFGIAIRDGDIYAFEACDFLNAPTFRGRLVCFRLVDGKIVDAHVVATGLDNGCHQIDFIGDNLCVIDTYNQQIIRFSRDFAEREIIRPFGLSVRGDWQGGYVHCNSLLCVGDRIFLLLHNGGRKSGMVSAIAVLDADWREMDRWPLPGLGCHNIVPLEDGTILCCGSLDGDLIDLDRPLAKITDMMTRGLSVDDDTVVVGASMFSIRHDRLRMPGQVHFLDRDLRPRALLELPGAPTDIRKLDGKDYSLSDFHRGKPFLIRGPQGGAI